MPRPEEHATARTIRVIETWSHTEIDDQRILLCHLASVAYPALPCMHALAGLIQDLRREFSRERTIRIRPEDLTKSSVGDLVDFVVRLPGQDRYPNASTLIAEYLRDEREREGM